GERYELLDVDARARRRLERAQLLVREGDVLVLLDLVALDQLAALDGALAARAVDLLSNARAAGLVEQVEAGGFGVRRYVELDGDRHQPEAHRPRPHRTRRHVLQESVRPGPMSIGAGRRPDR